MVKRAARVPKALKGLQTATAVLEARPHRRLRLAHPSANPREDKHELVLDADDLVVGLVPEKGAPLVNLGHAGFGLLLGAGIGLAGWFSFGASIRETRDAFRILKRLRKERALIKKHPPNEADIRPWQVRRLRMDDAMLRLNRVDKWEQRVRAAFSGLLVGVGSSAEIYAYATSPYLLGGLSAGLAASSVVALTVAAPIISVFAGANAVMQFTRVYRACRARRFLPSIARANPWAVAQFDAKHFVRGRLRQIRTNAAFTGLGFTCIAAGIPLSFWGGPYGLAVLVPGIVTVALTNHYEAAHIEYTNPMRFEEERKLVLTRQIVNEMGLAKLEHALLKQLKNAKRADYLVGANRGAFVRTLSAPVRALQRATGKARHNGESPERSMYRFFGSRLDILVRYWEHRLDGFTRHHHETDQEIQALIDDAKQNLNRVRMDRLHCQQEWTTLQWLPTATAVQRLCNAVVDQGLFDDFALRIGRDKVLRDVFEIPRAGTKALSVDEVVTTIAQGGPHAQAWRSRLFAVGENLFLTTLKKWRQSRACEMADLAVQRIHASRAARKQAKLSAPVAREQRCVSMIRATAVSST